MTCRIEFKEEQLAELEQRYRAGETLMELSFAYGIHTSTVSLRLKERGVELRAKGKRKGHRRLL